MERNNHPSIHLGFVSLSGTMLLAVVLVLLLTGEPAEGFGSGQRTRSTVKPSRISSPGMSSSVSPTSAKKLLLPSGNHNALARENPYPLGATKRNVATEDLPEAASTNDIRSQSIRDMAAFVSVQLLEVVVTESLKDESESTIDATAIQRLTQALQGSRGRSEKETKAPPPALDDDDEPCDGDELFTKISSNEEEEILSPASSELPVQDSFFPPPIDSLSPEEEDWRNADLPPPPAMEGFPPPLDEDTWHEPPPVAEPVYPEGSVDLPRPEPPAYEVSPLEVVASHVVPLRPGSVPKRSTPVEAAAEPSVVAIESIPMDPNEPNLEAKAPPTSLEPREVPNTESPATPELVQRALLARRIAGEKVALEKEASRKEEGFRRRLLAQRLVYDQRAAAKERARTDEGFHRRLLARQLGYASRATRPSTKAAPVEPPETSADVQDAEATTKTSPEPWNPFRRDTTLADPTKGSPEEKENHQAAPTDGEEIVRRRLLAQRLESAAAQARREAQRTEEVFRRRLLGERLKYDKLINAIAAKETSSAAVSSESNEEQASGPIHETVPPIDSEEAQPAAITSEINHEVAEIDYTQISRHDWVSSLPTVSRERYQREARVAHAFRAREFRPSFWATNRHFQTIAGTLLRREAMYSRGVVGDLGTLLNVLGVGRSPSSGPLEEFAWDERLRVDTKDGDFFDVDWKYAAKPTGSHDNGDSSNNNDAPVCLICHGLESCSDSDDVREIAIACNEIGMDAACLNFRGCSDGGDECNLTPRSYHLGFTDDLRQYVGEVHAKSPGRRIYLAGFSLGAGVVTKLLAELGPKAYEYNVCGAATNAVPFDVGQNHKELNEPGFTQKVYGDRLLASMKTRMTKNYDICGFDFDRSEIDKCQNIMDVENLIICSVFGFDDALDYYEKVKTIDKLHRICVPQYVLHARDDPFFVGLERVPNDASLPLVTHYTEHGGHCGFVLHQKSALERQEASKTSWMPTQLARFLAHVEAEHRATESPSADSGQTAEKTLVA